MPAHIHLQLHDHEVVPVIESDEPVVQRFNVGEAENDPLSDDPHDPLIGPLRNEAPTV